MLLHRHEEKGATYLMALVLQDQCTLTQFVFNVDKLKWHQKSYSYSLNQLAYYDSHAASRLDIFNYHLDSWGPLYMLVSSDNQSVSMFALSREPNQLNQHFVVPYDHSYLFVKQVSKVLPCPGHAKVLALTSSQLLACSKSPQGQSVTNVLFEVPLSETILDFAINPSKQSKAPPQIFVLTQRTLLLMAFENDQLTLIKKQEKETSLQSKFLGVHGPCLLVADSIQGVQVIGLPNLIPVKAWRIP